MNTKAQSAYGQSSTLMRDVGLSVSRPPQIPKLTYEQRLALQRNALIRENERLRKELKAALEVIARLDARRPKDYPANSGAAAIR
jgi:hypothetical protein